MTREMSRAEPKRIPLPAQIDIGFAAVGKRYWRTSSGRHMTPKRTWRVQPAASSFSYAPGFNRKRARCDHRIAATTQHCAG
jgi:hypothetical protein